MGVKNVSGVVPDNLHEIARATCETEGLTMSTLVSSALAFYLALPGAARRSVRFVMSSQDRDANALLVEGCGKAIARAGNQGLNRYLSERGKALGLNNRNLTEQELEAESNALVDEVRRSARLIELEAELDAPAI